MMKDKLVERKCNEGKSSDGRIVTDWESTWKGGLLKCSNGPWDVLALDCDRTLVPEVCNLVIRHPLYVGVLLVEVLLKLGE